jgi:hypothetical protein
MGMYPELNPVTSFTLEVISYISLGRPPISIQSTIVAALPLQHLYYLYCVFLILLVAIKEVFCIKEDNLPYLLR